MTHPAQYSLWLLPRADQEAELSSLIARIAGELDGPRFEPHLTIQGDLALTPDQLRPTLTQLAERVPVQRWPVTAVDGTSHFFRCLFLRFDTHSAFGEMQAVIRAASGTADGLSPFPHLSLAYGQALEAYARERRTLTPAFSDRTLVFDRLAVCRSSSHVPIAEWTCLAHYPLRLA